MTPSKKRKIALIGYRHSLGGAERILSNLSFIFQEIGYEIHVIVMIDDITYPYAGKLFNVGALRSSGNSFFNKLSRFKALRNYIITEQFDAIIDFRFRVNVFQELMIYRFAYKAPIRIQTVHLGDYKGYLFKNPWLSRFVFSDFDSVVCTAKEQQNLIKSDTGLQNLSMIYNPIDIKKIHKLAQEPLELPYHYIIAVGRFFEVKQFNKLIPAYAKSMLPQQNIHLILLGRGHQKELLEETIKETSCPDKIHLIDFQENPFNYMKNALFLVNSSLYEGLPMVLLEALACETPLIAFDCPTGPSEIIQDEFNGILVENQNFDKLTQAMDRMATDLEFYQRCKNNTLKSVQPFDTSVIRQAWIDLLNQLFKAKGL